MIYIPATSTAAMRIGIINHLPSNYISSVFLGILDEEGGWGGAAAADST